MSDRRTLTRLYGELYRRARKKEKGQILDEFLALTSYQRCHGACLLRHQGKRMKVSSQRVL